MTVHFIDVGQGDSIFISLPDNENILIDTGSPAAGPVIVKYLKSIGIRKIDHLITTHLHDDHFGGIFSVLSEFVVENFYDNGFSNFGSAMYGDYIKSVRKELSKYNILQAGEFLHFNNVRIEVLNPLLPPTGDLNNDSIVLKIKHGQVNILLSGDMGAIGERRLLNIDSDLNSQVVKIAHHGENSASSNDYLKSIKPETTIVSVGRINKYARPHNMVMKRLEQAGPQIYRTDQSGHILIKSNAETYSVFTEK